MSQMTNNQRVSMFRRAYATPGLHRVVPWPVALQTVRLRAARLWGDPDMRELATDSMRFVLAESERADEIDAAARRWVFETIKRDELTWRPWQTTRFPVDNAEILRGMQRAGRGVIISFFHHGQYGGFFGSLARCGIHSHVAVLPMFFDPPKPGYDGLRDQRHIATVRRGATVFSAKGSYDHMLELLDAGRAVGLASDLPGSLPMTILGRRVLAGSGAARLCRDSGAPVVPITSVRRGSLQALVVGDPIEAAHDSELADIQQAIADAHAPALLAWPEALMEPTTRWTLADHAVSETAATGSGVSAA